MFGDTRNSLSAASLLLTLAFATQSSAAADYLAGTLTFDDLSASSPLPASYGGFTWGDRWFTNPSEGSPVGASAPYLAIGGNPLAGSLLIRRSDGSDFYFDGADFWSRRGVDGVGDFSFVLYNDGVTVYNGDVDPDKSAGRVRFDDTPTLKTAPYLGPVDAMAFFFDNDDYDHLAMDNFRFRAMAPAEAIPQVPEPGTIVLTLGGLGLLGWAQRRRDSMATR